MPQLSVYLNFPGTCEEALGFYRDAFNGEIKAMQRYGEAPMESSASDANRIMHSEFVADGMMFMASDAPGSAVVKTGSNITLSVQHENEDDQASVFDKLAEGGNVSMPLQDTFWGARFGMLTDKFGVSWMFNCEKKNA